MVNLFDDEAGAQRYAKWRPFFHPVVMARLSAEYEDRLPFRRALDVGCGTGQSSQALTALAERVYGIDLSMSMLRQASEAAEIRYVQASAEQLPFGGALFDLATVSAAFHWFDQATFLGDVRRVLGPGGALVLYDNGITGLDGNEAFWTWYLERYCGKFPTPPRRNKRISSEDAKAQGFSLEKQEDFSNIQELSLRDLIFYLSTQTNLLAVLNSGEMGLEEVIEWLEEELRPFFVTETAPFQFRGHIVYLEKRPLELQEGAVS